MTKNKIKKMILELIRCLDEDIYDSFIPETSEDPDEIPRRMNELVEIVKKYIKID